MQNKDNLKSSIEKSLLSVCMNHAIRVDFTVEALIAVNQDGCINVVNIAKSLTLKKLEQGK